MGMLVNGKWTTGGWKVDKTGHFLRGKTAFHHRVDRKPGAQFPVEAERYHLYVSLACPWAHRTLILRKLKKLTDVISLSIVDPFMGEEGWHFSDGPACIPDSVNGAAYLREIYIKAKPDINARVTVPVLWDKKLGTIVNNESREIMRMFDVEFSGLGDSDVNFYPEDLQKQIDQRIDEIYQPINNGVYRAGFARSQEAYNEAVGELFSKLDGLEIILSKQHYLCGPVITEADWCLFTTLVRFDMVYHYHFKCNVRRIADYPYLWNYLLRLYRVPGVSETCNFDHIKKHYYQSHESINPSRIVPDGPQNYFKKSGELQKLYRGRYLEVKTVNGWEYVDRYHCKGAVIIVGLTDENRVIFVEQERLPLGRRVVEMPAGLVADQKDSSGESWVEAAKRELLEETGYEAEGFSLLAQGPTTPGLSSEMATLCLAQGIKKVSAGGGDESENIVVHEVPLGEVEGWLEKCRENGLLVDTKVYAGLYFLKQK